MARLPALFLVAAAVVSCASDPQSVYSYTPTASVPTEEAQSTISRALEGQPGKFAVNDVEVTNEKISYSKVGYRRLVFIKTTSRVDRTTFFFDSMARMDIHKKSSGYLVRVFDQAGNRRLYVVIPDEQLAHRFMDSLLSMSQVTSEGRVP